MWMSPIGSAHSPIRVRFAAPHRPLIEMYSGSWKARVGPAAGRNGGGEGYRDPEGIGRRRAADIGPPQHGVAGREWSGVAMTMANAARKLGIPEPCLLCGGEKQPDELVCAEGFDRGVGDLAAAGGA